jgi:hypothetical protein
MRVLTVAASVAYTIYLLSLGSLDVSQTPFEVLVVAVMIVLPVLIGLLGGWWAVPIFAAAFSIGMVLDQVLFWTDDPKLAGIDDLPPASSIVFTLPFLLLLVAFGAALRQRMRERTARP